MLVKLGPAERCFIQPNFKSSKQTTFLVILWVNVLWAAITVFLWSSQRLPLQLMLLYFCCPVSGTANKLAPTRATLVKRHTKLPLQADTQILHNYTQKETYRPYKMKKVCGHCGGFLINSAYDESIKRRSLSIKVLVLATLGAYSCHLVIQRFEIFLTKKQQQ